MKPHEVFAIRRANLRTLIDRHFNGQQARLAETLDCSSSQISRMMKPPSPGSSWRRNMSEETARKIETVLNLPPGSMDTPGEHYDAQGECHPIHVQEPAATYRTAHYAAADPEHRVLIDDVVDILLHQPVERVYLVRELLSALPRRRQ